MAPKAKRWPADQAVTGLNLRKRGPIADSLSISPARRSNTTNTDKML